MQTDAKPIKNNDYYRINKNTLKDITFEDVDAVSLLFLLHGNQPNGLKKVQNALQQSKDDPNFWLQHLTSFQNWNSWLFEALMLTQNIEMLQKQFGYTTKEINHFKNFRLAPTNHVNGTLRNLYFMCEHMDCQSKNELLRKMYGSVTQPDFEFLEYHVLYWMKMKIIQTFENQEMANFTRLLGVLKTMAVDDTPFYIDLSAISSKYDNTGQRESTGMKDHQNGYHITTEHETVKFELLESTNCDDTSDDLCVIINLEEYFIKERREGSQKDVDNLIRTFRGCKFDIALFKNLNSARFRETLSQIPKAFKNRYKCIIVCVLSHGNKDEVICFDDMSVSYDEIREMICQPELKNVIKIVLLQSCRGSRLGVSERLALTIDGPSEKQKDPRYADIRIYENFVLWHSTLDNFVSYRDEKSGTLFIQTLCEVLQHEVDNRSLYNISRIVTKKLGTREGPFRQNTEIKISGLADYDFPSFSKHVGTS